MSEKLTPVQKERRALMRHIRSQVNVLNKRRGALLRENERLGIERDAVDDVLMEMWRKKTKTASKNKLSTGRLSHMSLKTLRDLGGFIDDYAGVKDKKGRVQGSHYKHYNARERYKMETKALNALNKKYYTNKKHAIENQAAALGVTPDYSGLKKITRTQYRRMISLFSAEDLEIFRSENLLSSDQIVEIARYATEGMMDRLPQAIDEVYSLFGNRATALANMKQMQQQDPRAFKDLVVAYMEPTAIRRERRLSENEIFRAITGTDED